MPTAPASPINGLAFKLVFFDFIYMLGELLSAVSELHVKIQLVDRYCSKTLHNLELLRRKRASEDELREFLRAENRELVIGLERQNIFYDKYRLRLLRIHHAGTQGELLVEDTYNGWQYVIPVKRTVKVLLTHVFDSTTVQEMNLFPEETAVLRLTSSWDANPGETERKVLIELHEAAQHVHVYVKKEKLAAVEYLASGQAMNDPEIIARSEALESEKDRFLESAVIRELFPQAVKVP